MFSLFNEVYNSYNYLKSDIISNDNDYVINVDVPGVLKEDINLEIKNNSLSISIKNTLNESNGKCLLKERPYNDLFRSFELKDLDENNIKAKLDNGVLTIIIGKKNNNNSKNILID